MKSPANSRSTSPSKGVTRKDDAPAKRGGSPASVAKTSGGNLCDGLKGRSVLQGLGPSYVIAVDNRTLNLEEQMTLNSRGLIPVYYEPLYDI